jgi:hypothetical protein
VTAAADGGGRGRVSSDNTDNRICSKTHGLAGLQELQLHALLWCIIALLLLELELCRPADRYRWKSAEKEKKGKENAAKENRIM